MLSPRLAANAALAARMWEASGHAAVDGVLVIDPVALRAFLDATGPVHVGDRQIRAGNVVEELEHKQYVRFGNATTIRRDALGDIAAAVFTVLDRGAWDPSVLAARLAKAARGRHVMVWSRRADAQQAWQEARVAGALGPDSLLVSMLNRGGNKLDRFLDVNAALTLTPARRASVRGTLTVRLHNRVPGGEPRYVAGPHPDSGVSEGDYLGIIAVSLPGAATRPSIDGRHDYAVFGRDGMTRVLGYQLRIPRDGSETVVVRFTLPRALQRITIEASARVPALAWRVGRLAWSDRSARTVPLP
jgi:hypothetical protein